MFTSCLLSVTFVCFNDLFRSAAPSPVKEESTAKAAEELKSTKAKQGDLELKCTALQNEVAFFERENARLLGEAADNEKEMEKLRKAVRESAPLREKNKELLDEVTVLKQQLNEHAKEEEE